MTMETALKTIRLLKLPWQDEKLQGLLNREEVDFKILIVQLWLTFILMIAMGCAVICACLVRSASICFATLSNVSCICQFNFCAILFRNVCVFKTPLKCLMQLILLRYVTLAILAFFMCSMSPKYGS